jgi:hypothetical protein
MKNSSWVSVCPRGKRGQEPFPVRAMIYQRVPLEHTAVLVLRELPPEPCWRSPHAARSIAVNMIRAAASASDNGLW